MSVTKRDRNQITATTSTGPPPGAGGYGPRQARWEGEAPPSGGEGFMNNGLMESGGKPIVTGGMPWQQQTMMGVAGQVYRIAPGDTLASIAAKFHGPGASYQAIMDANPGLSTSQGYLASGQQLLIPPAAHAGPPAPGGPTGNGVGGGSVSRNQSLSTRAKQAHTAGYYAVPRDQAQPQAAAPAPGSSGRGGKRGGGRRR